MNKEEILAMEAGRALNMLIVEKVMGLIAWEEKRGEYTHIVFQKPDEREPYRRSRNWESEMSRYKLIGYSEINNHIHVVSEIKNYSTDISAALETIEKLVRGKLEFNFEVEFSYEHYFVRFKRIHKNSELNDGEALEKSFALAICKAALLAVMDS